MKRFGIILTIVIAVLLIPFIAMQFSHEVVWTASDFIIMGMLLLGTGLLFDLVLRKVRNTRYKVALCIVVVALFLLIWVELAVGLFGSPLAGS